MKAPFFQALSGVRILDLSQYLPGPFGTLMLSDMGADVLKIVPPHGDGMTQLGPRDHKGEPIFYKALNAGKRVSALNLKTDEGRYRLLALLEDADVLIESFRPGVMARLGFDPVRLREDFPRLILCSVSGYGSSGPLCDAAGHDGNYLAQAGALYAHTGEVSDPPVSDISGGLFAALSICGALFARERTGEGCHIDLGLADTVMPLMGLHIAAFGELGTVPAPRSNYLNGGAAYYRLYRCADAQRLFVGAVEPKFWQTFCEAAGKPEWIYRQNEPLPQTDLMADLEAFFAQHSLGRLREMFAHPDCCVSPVCPLDKAIESSQTVARGLVRRAGHGALQALYPARIDGAPPPERLPLAESEARFLPRKGALDRAY